MKICPNCGEMSDDNQKNCPVCGSELPAPPPKSAPKPAVSPKQPQSSGSTSSSESTIKSNSTTNLKSTQNTDHNRNSRPAKGPKQKSNKGKFIFLLLVLLVILVIAKPWQHLKKSSSEGNANSISESSSVSTENAQQQEEMEEDEVPAPAPVEEKEPLKEYKISFDIDFAKNLIFNKYDVDFMINDTVIDTLEHGESTSFSGTIPEGTHKIVFAKNAKPSIRGERTITVTGDLSLGYRIECKKGSVEIDSTFVEDWGNVASDATLITEDIRNSANVPYKDIVTVMENAGFTKITAKSAVDESVSEKDYGLTMSVSIDGVPVTEYKRGDTVKKDAPVVVRYYASEKTVRKELEKVLEQKVAKWAVITAMTNCFADDVRSSDGLYDETKFHAYNDLSGYHLKNVKEYGGEWSVVDATTWHVDDLILRVNGTDEYMKISCNARTKGKKNIVVSKVDVVRGSLDDVKKKSSKSNKEHFDAGDDTPYLTVSRSLVSKGRK